jgi:hypothetical protein
MKYKISKKRSLSSKNIKKTKKCLRKISKVSKVSNNSMKGGGVLKSMMPSFMLKKLPGNLGITPPMNYSSTSSPPKNKPPVQQPNPYQPVSTFSLGKTPQPTSEIYLRKPNLTMQTSGPSTFSPKFRTMSSSTNPGLVQQKIATMLAKKGKTESTPNQETGPPNTTPILIPKGDGTFQVFHKPNNVKMTNQIERQLRGRVLVEGTRQSQINAKTELDRYISEARERIMSRTKA